MTAATADSEREAGRWKFVHGCVIGATRKHGLLKRHHHADVSGLWIHGADEDNREKQHQMFEIGDRHSCRQHDKGSDQEKFMQIIACSEEAGCQRSGRSSEKRPGGEYTDAKWVKANLSQISREYHQTRAPRGPRRCKAPLLMMLLSCEKKIDTRLSCGLEQIVRLYQPLTLMVSLPPPTSMVDRCVAQHMGEA
jgi:hypothetical protein